jgi:hypothetical protein
MASAIDERWPTDFFNFGYSEQGSGGDPCLVLPYTRLGLVAPQSACSSGQANMAKGIGRLSSLHLACLGWHPSFRRWCFIQRRTFP